MLVWPDTLFRTSGVGAAGSIPFSRGHWLLASVHASLNSQLARLNRADIIASHCPPRHCVVRDRNMTPTKPQSPSYRFPEWELRPVERALIVRGAPVSIGSRAFDVLVALAEKPGQIVSKSELLDAAWRGLVVEENNISVQIATLRKVLGPQAIATAPGLGYRLSVSAEEPQGRPVPARESLVRGVPGAETARIPSAPDLIARDDAVRAICDLIAGHRVVSVVGTGGVGKTSVVRAVLAEIAPADGEIYWVDLAALGDRSQFVPVLARVLGIDLDSLSDPREDLLSALAGRRALITLDSCEYVLDEVSAFVRGALESAPAVHWLTTSCEPLHLSSEVVYRLEPLEVPEPEIGLQRALHYGAIALLCRRTAATDRRFTLDDRNLASVIELCRQLDGLPLAIEMAASRVATLGLWAVLQQLGQRLRLLAGPREAPARHHTLRSTLDWSYALLSPGEQRAFRRLAPFHGGFNLTMALQIMAATESGSVLPDDVQGLEMLSALVDKSLVHAGAETSRRFFLFESAREYAWSRLEDEGEADLLRRRHAEVVEAWFANAQSDLDSLRDEVWADRYVPERPNVRAALVFACKVGEPNLLARLVAEFARIDSFVRGPAEVVHLNVPIDVLEKAARPLRAAACLEFSWAHFLDGDRRVGTALALRALDDFKHLNDVAGTYRALAQLCRLYESRPGGSDDARRVSKSLLQLDVSNVPLRTRLFCEVAGGLHYGGDQSLERLHHLEGMAVASGFHSLAAVCRVHIIDRLLIERRFEDAVTTAQDYTDAGESRPRAKGTILTNRVLGLVQLNRSAEARESAYDALRLLPSGTYLVVGAFALAAAREGRFTDAALMSGYCAQVRRHRDERPDPAEAVAIEETFARLHTALSNKRLEELLTAGAALVAADALAIALRG
jgi:predicted ATPase/DNA-binding winged helix-turn-helix (wHTH) protein